MHKLSILLLFVSVLMMSNRAKAQQVPMTDTAAIANLSQTLTISHNQATKVWSIMKKHRHAVDSLLSAKSGKPMELPRALKWEMQKQQAAVTALLTPAQQAKLQQAIAAAVSARQQKAQQRMQQIKEQENSREPISGAKIKRNS